MKKMHCVLVLILVSLLMGFNPRAISQELKKSQLEKLAELKERDPTMRIRWEKKTFTPAHLSGKLTDRMEGTAEEIATRFLKEVQPLFKFKDVDKELSIVGVKSDKLGWQHVSLQQMYKDVPVEGKTALVHINKEKEVRSVSAKYLPNIDLDVTPKITKENAIEAAKAHLKSEKELPKEPKAKLVVYTREDKIYLAWKIGLVSEEPLGNYDYFIDAHTGGFIYRYSKIKYTLDRNTYTANNMYILPGTLVISEGQTSTDNIVQNAHNNMGRVYRYFKDKHNRDSWDNGGATIVTTVHYGSNLNNAFWYPDPYYQFAFGDGDGIDYDPLGGGYDLVVHEFTHAITDTTAKFNYERQSGALHESFSDIFACFADPDWMIGEDVYTPNIAGDASRYLDDPPLGGQPDHMNNFQDYPAGTACVRDNDYCGVHTNSGIPNKAAYLVTEGGTHQGITVCGIGRVNARKIYYKALTTYLKNTPEATFEDACDAVLDATANIFPGDLAKTVTVQNAYAAVGIGNVYNGLIVCLTPSPLTVKEDEGRTLTALVTNNGIAVSGATVSLAVANVNRATVNPTSINTGGDGRATCTVTGVAEGSTILTGTTTVGNQTASTSITINVYKPPCDCTCSPAGGSTNKQVAWIMLAPAIVIIIWRYKVRRKKD